MSKRSKSFPHSPAAYGASNSGNRIIRQIVHGGELRSSTAGGVLAFAVTMDPSAVTGTDWADFSSAYDEFRVIGVAAHIISLVPNGTAVNNNIAAIAFDNESNAAPTTFSEVRQYGTSHVLSTIMTNNRGQPATFTWWRPTAGKDTAVAWYDVATPSGSLGAIKFYVDGLTASTAYLGIAYDFYIEFRGRR